MFLKTDSQKKQPTSLIIRHFGFTQKLFSNGKHFKQKFSEFTFTNQSFFLSRLSRALRESYCILLSLAKQLLAFSVVFRVQSCCGIYCEKMCRWLLGNCHYVRIFKSVTRSQSQRNNQFTDWGSSTKNFLLKGN